MEDVRCQECGTPLPSEASSGICPRCAMQLALQSGSPSEPAGSSSASAPDRTGQRIDRYVLQRPLGQGGMGEVWLAEQSEPIKRQVALKIIKRGLDTERFVARFESERQAIALMQHRAVAKVLDAGATDDGLPYFVMEYVPGLPITAHCDRERLPTRQRLELFREVCDGVQHAHQKAILHRDLKPANVLVSSAEGGATPKIIDFGVAKALDQKLTERSLFTELGVLVGTPEYMSPEQARGGDDVDTRTDVYSLGVLLYELLTGCLPFEGKELRAAGYDGIRRMITEQEPPRPSLRVSQAGEALAESAEQRRTDPGSLSRQLRGDLDWIVMRALEKDPERRYRSPAELAADVERYLSHQPVLAGPPSAAYRARKFVRRHRFGVALGAVAALALIAVVTLQTVNAARLKRERDRANREAATANRVAGFLAGLFEEANPNTARGAEATAREILERGTRTIEEGLEDEPEIQARLMTTIGWIDIELGLYERALELFERSAELRREVLGDDHPETLRSEFSAGAALVFLGRFEEAEPRLRSVFDRQLNVLDEESIEPWDTADYIAQAAHQLGRREEALEWHRRSLEGYTAVDSESEATFSATANVGLTLKDLGQLDEAEPYYRRALQGFRSLVGEDHPQTLAVANNLGNLLMTMGRLDEAEETFRQTLEIRRRVLGEDHPHTLESKNDLATALHHLGRMDETASLRREVLESTRAQLGDDHPHTLRALNNMGSLLMRQGKLAEAEPFLFEAAEGIRGLLGAEHPNVLIVRGNLGELYTRQGRHAEAEQLLREIEQNARRVLPREHVITGFSIRKLGSALAAAGRHAEAEELLLESVEILDAAVGPDQPHTVDAVQALVDLYAELGRGEDEQRWRERLP